MTTHQSNHPSGADDRSHERFEHLLMKAVDGVLSPSERATLDGHLTECPSCSEELRDFVVIKEDTDMLSKRILADARIEPPRSHAAAAVVGAGTAVLAAAVLLLLGFSAWTFFTDANVPTILKVGTGLLGLTGLSFFLYALTTRLRGLAHDPYKEIDQ